MILLPFQKIRQPLPFPLLPIQPPGERQRCKHTRTHTQRQQRSACTDAGCAEYCGSDDAGCAEGGRKRGTGGESYKINVEGYLLLRCCPCCDIVPPLPHDLQCLGYTCHKLHSCPPQRSQNIAREAAAPASYILIFYPTFKKK